MYTSAELLARRDQLASHARTTIAPLQQWWHLYGIEDGFDTPLPSYFNVRLRDKLQEREEEIERIARQHPRYITEKKLDDFERDYQTLSDYLLRLLAEAHRYEELRPQVTLSERDLYAITVDIHHYNHEVNCAWDEAHRVRPHGGHIPETTALLDQLEQLEDIARKVKKSAEADYEEWQRWSWRHPEQPVPSEYRFKLEHDCLYLKELDARVQEMLHQFTALHTPVAELANRVETALAEWRGILGLLEESPLTTRSWHLHARLHVLTQQHPLSVPDLERTYEDTKRAVHAAFDAQFVRRAL